MLTLEVWGLCEGCYFDVWDSIVRQARSTFQPDPLHDVHTPLGITSHEKVSRSCSETTIPSAPPPLSSARGFGGSVRSCEKRGKKRDPKSLMSSGSSSPQKEKKRTLALAFTCNQCNGRSTLMV